jgi:hypothetical protein
MKIPQKILKENYFSTAVVSRRCLKKPVQDFESQRFDFRKTVKTGKRFPYT